MAFESLDTDEVIRVVQDHW